MPPKSVILAMTPFRLVSVYSFTGWPSAVCPKLETLMPEPAAARAPVLPSPRGDVLPPRAAADLSAFLPEAVGEVPEPEAFLFLLQAPADSTRPPITRAHANLA
jgi:hypothetical protein